MNPQDRQAGPETDNAIAIHIMDWEWLHDGFGAMAWFGEHGDSGFGDGGIGVYRRVSWCPSRNIELAWIVLEHFAWPKYYVRIVRTETGRWRCDIELNGGDGPTRSGNAETAPLAICRAALAAVGV